MHLPTQDLTQVGSNEGQQRANARVNTGLARSRTALTPRNQANKLARRVDDRTAAVALARVLAAGRQARAKHVVRDLGDAVVLAAGSARHDGDVDLAQCGGRRTARAGGAPAGHRGGAARGGVRAGGRKRGVADGRAGGDGGCELPDGDVVVEGRGREAWVDLDRGDADEGSAGVAVLRRVSLGGVSAAVRVRGGLPGCRHGLSGRRQSGPECSGRR